MRREQKRKEENSIAWCGGCYSSSLIPSLCLPPSFVFLSVGMRKKEYEREREREREREKEREEREGERDESLAGWSGGSSAVPSGLRRCPRLMF